MARRTTEIDQGPEPAAVSRTTGRAGLTRPSSLASEVYDAILGQIMSLRIPPRARITVDNLARELNVSQTPIREALSRLEAEGMVVKTHLVGYSAAPQLTLKQFDELYELRLLLEPAGARKAAEAMDEAVFADIRQLAEAMSRRDGSSDERHRYTRFARLDAEFHDRIVDIAGNELIRETLARLHIHVQIFRLLFHSRVTEDAIEEHGRIIAALAHRDGEKAAAAMRRHIERSRDRLRPTLDAG